MRPEGSRASDSGWLTLLLVALSALSARFAISEPETPWYVPVFLIGSYTGGASFLGAIDARTGWLRRSGPGGTVPAWPGILLGMLLIVAPYAANGARILADTYCRPLEQVSIVALTNFAFFAAALSRIRGSLLAAGAVSFVLVVAALMLGEHPAIVPLTAAYGGLGVAWLATRYWRDATAATQPGRTVRFPRVPVLGLGLLLAGVTAASTQMAQGVPDIWGEWVPASGGSRWANPAALLGVGDGDWVVSGPRAKSTGATDSDHFLESDLPTLYDVLTETYGEPRSPQELQRAIFVDSEQMLSPQGHKAPDSGAAGRRFSIYRKDRSRRPPAAREAADALLYVEGRVPLHLALRVYEHFDGVQWHERAARQAPCSLKVRGPDNSWLWLPERSPGGIFAGTRPHQLRFGRFSSDRLPLPNHSQRFRLGRQVGDHVLRWAVDVLSWASDGILQARQVLPPGTCLDVISFGVDRAALGRSDELRPCPPHGADPCLDVPDALRGSAAALAEAFAHLPRGLPQIEALLDHLRTHCAHDRDATVPPACADPIHHFLHQSRRGPAYQFATAAALALRSLGYPTRVVAGFYADPAGYDARMGNTPIQADDAHFWIEVRTARGDWLAFDPTPGYRTEWYERTWRERIAAALASLGRTLTANPIAAVLGATLSGLIWWRRLWLRERLFTLWCLWWPFQGPEQRICNTLRLLDLRSRVCGRPRPAGRTPLAWYGRVDDPACRVFLGLLYAALYNRGGVVPPCPADRLVPACRGAVRATAPGRLRAALGGA